MGKRCKILFTSIFLVFTLVLSGCSSSGGSGTLKVGVRSDIMNFGYLNDKTEKYYGLEIDIAKDMAERMGYDNVEFVTVTPDDRKQTLLDGKVDCLIACYSISDTRKENFDFSEAYYVDSAKIMVEKASMITSFDDLKGKSIGVLSGSNTGPELSIKLTEYGLIGKEEADKIKFDPKGTTKYKNITIKALDKYTDLDEALEEGTVDAACMDGVIAQTYMDEEREFMDIKLAEQKYGVATNKGSERSKKAADAIKEMTKDGTIKELIDKWN